MAKFDLNDFTKPSSGPKESGKRTFGNKTKSIIVYQDETMRVIQRGTEWFEFVVYNYVKMPPGFPDNKDLRYGMVFSNQQLAQKGFLTAKNNFVKVVEV